MHVRERRETTDGVMYERRFLEAINANGSTLPSGEILGQRQHASEVILHSVPRAGGGECRGRAREHEGRERLADLVADQAHARKYWFLKQAADGSGGGRQARGGSGRPNGSVNPYRPRCRKKRGPLLDTRRIVKLCRSLSKQPQGAVTHLAVPNLPHTDLPPPTLPPTYANHPWPPSPRGVAGYIYIMWVNHVKSASTSTAT